VLVPIVIGVLGTISIRFHLYLKKAGLDGSLFIGNCKNYKKDDGYSKWPNRRLLPNKRLLSIIPNQGMILMIRVSGIREWFWQFPWDERRKLKRRPSSPLTIWEMPYIFTKLHWQVNAVYINKQQKYQYVRKKITFNIKYTSFTRKCV